MKRILFTISLFAISNYIFCQDFIISQSARTLHNGTYHSFLFGLPDVDKNEAEESWKKFMSNQKAKHKFDRKNNIWFSDNAKIPKISSNTVDVYAKIITDSNPQKKTSIIVWFDLGGAYLNPENHLQQTIAAREILSKYAMTASKDHAESIAKAEEKRLKDMENELKDSEKKQANYMEDIEKAKLAILKMQQEADLNSANQQKLREAIKKQKVKASDARLNMKRFN